MLRKGAIFLAMAVMLAACGHTPEERLVSGALIGAAVGATVGVVSDPYHHGHRGHHYRRHRGHGHGHHHHRRHRGWD